MSVLVSDVLAEARLLLNDTAGKVFDNTKLLPFFRKAYEEFQSWGDNYNLYTVKRQSLDLTPVTAVGNFIFMAYTGTVPTLPTDMRIPIRLYEKAVGEDRSFYTEMTELEFQPVVSTTTGRSTYDFWNFSGTAIYLPLITSPSTRNIMIEYIGSNIAIADAATTVHDIHFKTHLAARVAALAAMFVGQNESRAAACQDDSNAALDRILETMVRKTQGVYGTRRIPFGRSRRAYDSIRKWFDQ